MEEQKSFWWRQPGIFIKIVIAIYVSTVIFNYFFSEILRAYPIIVWWLDNWSLWLFQLWWYFVFLGVGMWPFNKIEGRYTRAITMFVTSWILGIITYLVIVHFDPTGEVWDFAIMGNLYFLIVFTSFTGDNFGWSDLPQSRQFLAIVAINLALSLIIGFSAIRWIPAWWFPLCQCILGPQLYQYVFRKMKQPMKNIAVWGLLFLATGLYIWILSLIGWYDFSLPDVVAPDFWKMGFFTPQGKVFFNFWCGSCFGVLVAAHNWPFRRIKQPWGGLLAVIFSAILAATVTVFLWWLFPNYIYPPATFGPDRWVLEVQSYTWIATMFCFLYTLGTGWASHADYLWKGQKTPGTWEDVD